MATKQKTNPTKKSALRVKNQLYSMHCSQCGRYTPHTLQIMQDWERYTCRFCGSEVQYRVG